jgi:cell division protein FtsB
MKLLTHIPAWLKSKYFIAIAAFLVIMLFLGRNDGKNDIFTQLDRRKELRGLEQSKQHYTNLINAERKQLQALEKNPASLEKVAREKYLMKKDGEELFIISEKPVPAKN